MSSAHWQHVVEVKVTVLLDKGQYDEAWRSVRRLYEDPKLRTITHYRQVGGWVIMRGWVSYV